MADIINDNQNAPSDGALGGPDAHGQAALLLVESLLHGLVSRSIITPETAVEIVAIAAEVKVEVAADLGDTRGTMQKSLHLLANIAASLKIDAK